MPVRGHDAGDRCASLPLLARHRSSHATASQAAVSHPRPAAVAQSAQACRRPRPRCTVAPPPLTAMAPYRRSSCTLRRHPRYRSPRTSSKRSARQARRPLAETGQHRQAVPGGSDQPRRRLSQSCTALGRSVTVCKAQHVGTAATGRGPDGQPRGRSSGAGRCALSERGTVAPRCGSYT